MNPFESHLRNTKNSLFGLIASRFLYIDHPHHTPHDAVSGQEAEVAERTKELQKKFLKGVAAYNHQWGEKVKSDKRQEIRYHYETIGVDLDDLDATRDQLKRVIEALERKYGDQFKHELRNNHQHLAVWKLIRALEKLKSLPQKGQEAVREAHRGRLYDRHERMTKSAEQREAWKKKPAYQEVVSVFDDVADDKEFVGLFQGQDGMVSQNQREARELFLALMAEKTRNFSDTFPLGDNFSNDPDENIRNYPFLYNEFLKHEGDKIAGDAVSEEAIIEAEANTREAHRKLKGIDSASDIFAGANISSNPLAPLPSVPATDDWRNRVNVLEGMVHRLRDKAGNAKDTLKEPQAGAWQRAADDLELHVAYAKAFLALSQLRDREDKVRLKFTRAELSRPERRKTVITLAMRKFMKSQEMVDYPKGTADWKYTLHPTVRRMLIASTYESGVARYEKKADGRVVYNDKNEGQHAWMLSTLVLSDYFNFKERGAEMDDDHAAVLKAVYLGGHVATLLEQTKEVYDPDPGVDGLLEAWIGVLKDHQNGNVPTDPAQRKAYFVETMGYWPPQYVEKYAKYTLADAEAALTQAKNDRENLQNFLEEAQKTVRDPYSAKSQQFIAAMRRGDYMGQLEPSVDRLGKIGIIDGASLTRYETQMKNLQLNFKISELEEKNMLQFFEGLGMNIEGMYPAYLTMLKEHPNWRTEYWDDMLLGSDEQFKELIQMFTIIIPKSQNGGKEDFIQGLQSIRAKYKGEKSILKLQASLQEGSEDFVVFDTFLLLREHLSERSEKAGMSDRAAKAMDQTLRGVHFADKASQYASEIFNMAIGPGQSPVNRAAGLVLMYLGYKSVRSAMKGDSRYGKAMRALFVAGALEVAVKELTGRGILDRAGLDGVASVMGGSRYEAVLMADAKENNDLKEISPEAHATALNELNAVPFNQVMEWYEHSDENGMPTEKGGKDYFPSQISINRIAPRITWDATDKKIEARRVVRETVKHFFRYVGDKQNKRGMEYGKEALKERWVRMIPGNKAYDPKYTPVFSEFDHSEWVQAGNVTSKMITWNMVMQAEIAPSKVDLTKTESMTGQLEATAQEWYEKMSVWTREHVLNPGSRYSEEFFKSMGEGAQQAKSLVNEYYEKTGDAVYFGKENLILWYNEHQYEIKRVAKDHYQLLVTGLKIPFKIVYAVDSTAIPWTLSKLEQIEKSLQNNKTAHISRELKAEDIVAEKEYMGSSNLELNPQFSYYGMYQEPFLRAFAAGSASNDMYYLDQGTNVGYYISEMTPKEADINPDDPIFSGSPSNEHHQVMTASREAAARFFYGKDVDKKLVEKYMYSIHTVVSTDPKKVYVFWRMPMENSPELRMQEDGQFADYRDPNKRKDRKYFEVNPSQTSWENIKRAFALDTDGVRKVLTRTGGYAAQVPRVVFAHWEVAGSVVGKIGKAFGGGQEFQDAVEAATKTSEGTRIFIDEAFTSGKSQHMALSEFYKDPVNAKLYAFSLAYAHEKGARLHTGLLEGRESAGGEAYTGSPYLIGELDFADMQKFYNDHIRPRRADRDIEEALEEKLGEEEEPPARP